MHEAQVRRLNGNGSPNRIRATTEDGARKALGAFLEREYRLGETDIATITAETEQVFTDFPEFDITARVFEVVG